MAVDARVPFCGLWLDAPESVLVARVETRQRDASDGDAGVVRRQLTEDTGAIVWQRIDASSSLEAIVRSTSAMLRTRLTDRLIRQFEAA